MDEVRRWVRNGMNSAELYDWWPPERSRNNIRFKLEYFARSSQSGLPQTRASHHYEVPANSYRTPETWCDELWQ